ncbi:FecCD family ABC transporter permease [Gulosibacter chungangensis]|uniref:Iron chelate uptake ABC transporter family permease subunit n=1 Tax=Gulosibacter chungangensis TaxID=979746 RepID=A0A7J5BAT2_9MICO|nr:iron chelate uptake ABC transporter family permease subunit [Gulosibacter chungangensis]KAB1643209.1 iron chelate uptake ABC transporter family permease subunit [Gulosibacter chungangensis]
MSLDIDRTPASRASTDRARPRSVVTGTPIRLRRTSFIIRPRVIAIVTVLLILSLGLAVLALLLGSVQVPLSDLVASMFGQSAEHKHNLVIQNIRFPQVVAALSAGAALGVSGAVFQSISNNALGSPDIIGLTTGAATGAISQIIFFEAGPIQVTIGALIGGIGTAVVIYLLSLKGGVTGGFRLVLIGIGVGALLSSLNSLMMVRGDVELAFTANVWISGSVDNVKWDQALPTLIISLITIPVIAALAKRATMVEMGDDMARQLGVNAEHTRRILILLAVVLAGIATSSVGPISFIALASGQLAKLLTRSGSITVFASAVMGSFLLMLAHVITAVLPVHYTLPIGQVTGLIGGIYLAWLLTRSKQV